MHRVLDSASPPPMIAGTDLVDKNKLDSLNILLVENEKEYSIFIKNVVEEAAKNFTYDRTISVSENKENFDKLVSVYKKTA